MVVVFNFSFFKLLLFPYLAIAGCSIHCFVFLTLLLSGAMGFKKSTASSSEAGL